MAISFVGSEVAGVTTHPPATDLDVNVHASELDDDTLIAFGHKNDNNGDISNVTGLTRATVLDRISTAGDDKTTAAFSRVASSEPASYAFQHSDSGNEEFAFSINIFRGVHADIYDVAPDSAHIAEGTDDSTPGPHAEITTVTDGAWVLACLALTNSEVNTPGAPSGYTLITSHTIHNRQVYVAYKLVATAGAETPGAWTHSVSANTAESIMYTIALKPAGVAGATGKSNPLYGPLGGPLVGPIG